MQFSHYQKKLSQCLGLFLSVFVHSLSVQAAGEKHAHTAIDWKPSNTKTVNEIFIKPYRQLAVNTSVLNNNIHQLCEKINLAEEKNISRTLTSSQRAFREMYINWANVQFISIGPMAYLKRTERFQYWPDKHTVGSRQLKRLIQQETHTYNNSEAPLTLADLQKKSVAVQGIPALERILFSKSAYPTKTECHIASLISQNLHSIAENNIHAWTQPPTLFVNELIHLDQGFGVYESEAMVANTLFNILSTQLLVIEQLKLQRALPHDNKPNKPTRLEAWRSQLSLTLIQENIHSLQQLYRYGFHPHLHQKNPILAKRIMDEFSRTHVLMKKSPSSLSSYIQQKNIHPTVQKMLSQLTILQKLINTRMARELNLSTKFNALDGD